MGRASGAIDGNTSSLFSSARWLWKGAGGGAGERKRLFILLLRFSALHDEIVGRLLDMTVPRQWACVTYCIKI